MKCLAFLHRTIGIPGSEVSLETACPDFFLGSFSHESLKKMSELCPRIYCNFLSHASLLNIHDFPVIRHYITYTVRMLLNKPRDKQRLCIANPFRILHCIHTLRYDVDVSRTEGETKVGFRKL